MTCVLSSTPFNHFNDHFPWLPMNQDTSLSHSSFKKETSQGYVSAGSDTRKSSTSSSKKRASRAGTRSVSTLSAAQLERKRANDREAQRAIRQRTKDHIDHQQRSIDELRTTLDAKEKLVYATQQRVLDLEKQNAYYHNRLNEAGLLLPAERQRSTDSTLLPGPTASPVTASAASITRPGSTSTLSNHSMTAQTAVSRHGSWQHPGVGFVGPPNTAMGLSNTPAGSNVPTATAWRSHEATQNAQGPMQAHASGSFHEQPVDWSSGDSFQSYNSQEQQRPQQYETVPPHQQQGFQQPTTQPYGTSAPPQSAAYHAQLTPQPEFPAMPGATSPNAFQVPSQPAFPQSTPYQVTAIQVPSNSAEYTSPHGQMQPPPLPSSFHPAGVEPAYQYRDDAVGRSYSLPNYPTA